MELYLLLNWLNCKNVCVFIVLSEIQKIEKSLIITTRPVKESWKNKFLQSPEGKQFLDNQQNDFHCLIVFEKDAETAIEEKFSEKADFQEAVMHVAFSF